MSDLSNGRIVFVQNLKPDSTGDKIDFVIKSLVASLFRARIADFVENGMILRTDWVFGVLTRKHD